MARKRSKQVVRPIDESNISGGQPLISGRGGIGPDHVEMPGDQHSRAQRGRAESEQEPLVVKEEDRPRRGRRKPYVSKGEKTNEQIKHQRRAKK